MNHLSKLLSVVTLLALPAVVSAVSLQDFNSLIDGGPMLGMSLGTKGARGDINGDGFDDLLVTSETADTDSANDGLVYLMYGSSSQLTSSALDSAVKISGKPAEKLGSAIASGDVNGDGYDDIIAAAERNSDAGEFAGAIYVIYGQSTQLSDQNVADAVQYRGEAAGDFLGSSVAVGDVNGDGRMDIVAGAEDNDDAGASAGAMYLLYGQAAAFTGGSISSAIQFTGEAAGDSAGTTVAMGDINGDGRADLIAGAYRNDDTASGAGAAYIIYGSASTLTTASLSTAVEYRGEALNDNAGVSVWADDFNGDGRDDLMVGAYRNDDGGTNAGAVYFVYGQSGPLAGGTLGSIEFTGEVASDNAGFAISSGNLNGDAYADAIIGATGNDDGATNAGAVYILYGQASNFASASLSTAVELTGPSASVGAPGALVGLDMTNDGNDELVIGGSGLTSGGDTIGAFYLVAGQSSALTAHSLSTDTANLGTTDYTRAGRETASGDLNGDGYDDLVITAPWNGTGANYGGGINVVYGQADVLTSAQYQDPITLYASQSSDEVGMDAVIVGDLNGDGYDDIIVGSRNYTQDSSDIGAVYIIYGSTTLLTDGTLESYPRITGTQDDEYFGSVLAIGNLNGDAYADLLLGAPYYNGSGTILGAVYVIYGSSTQLTSQVVTSAGIRLTGVTNYEYLGAQVAAGDINGDGYDDIIMGSRHFDSTDSINYGSIFIKPGQASQITTGTVSGLTQLTGGVTYNTNDLSYVGEELAMSELSTGDVNGDGYDDILASADMYMSSGTVTPGAAYLVYGQSASLSSGAVSNHVRLAGVADLDGASTTLLLEDLDQDGMTEILVAAQDASSTNHTDGGVVYYFPGQTTAYTSRSLSTGTIWEGYQDYNYGYGYHLASGDLNGDSYPELFTVSATDTVGNIYVGYMYVDADGDGELGSGVLATVADCNDDDATVSVDQTLYEDLDGDGLGTDAGTSTGCYSTLDGYTNNTDDTNDEIPNNGVEIDGDNVDNDGDGNIDEVNTLAENGEHPYYSTLDPTRVNLAASSIVRLRGKKHGRIIVTYGDNSKYRYNIFDHSIAKATVAQIARNSAYGITVQPNGKKTKLVNLYTGEKVASKKTSKAKFKVVDISQRDFRNDDKVEIVLVMTKSAKVRTVLLQPRIQTGGLRKKDAVQVDNPGVKASRTTLKKNRIILKSKSGKRLLTYRVNKDYELRLQ